MEGKGEGGVGWNGRGGGCCWGGEVWGCWLGLCGEGVEVGGGLSLKVGEEEVGGE